MNYLIKEKISIDVMNNLVNSKVHRSIYFLVELNGFNMRINDFPLPCPIVSYRLMTMFNPAFHSVRPIDFRRHCRERTINVAGVEGGIGLLYQFDGVV